jgi:hypothetical protein
MRDLERLMHVLLDQQNADAACRDALDDRNFDVGLHLSEIDARKKNATPSGPTRRKEHPN